MRRQPPAARRGKPIEDLSGLASLRDALAERARLAREAGRREREAAARAAREANLFRSELADVVPLEPTGRVEPKPPAPPAVPVQRMRDEQAVLAESLSDEIDIDRWLDTDDALSWRRSGIGADVVRRLRRGEWVVRAQIDLHGLRVDEAREALVAFLGKAVRDEVRCVRIIHGKGLGSIGREPVLKRKVPRWLVQREEVLAFCEARPNDGGAGVLIALLRVTRAGPG
ncbi:Smr/MutS family protein [Burkholderiaceae bacterium FT117]|uniref:Smr/MutS family protein n=1 Tax=Zeimonas sediminis TaxID=2944268 RepID=UPI002342F7F8|nr:Smr/MutS family protein [Zeimonas sediminis]MCM5569364.1 Smr/MutS family protein [Zeimonas sediminis]